MKYSKGRVGGGWMDSMYDYRMKMTRFAWLTKWFIPELFVPQGKPGVEDLLMTRTNQPSGYSPSRLEPRYRFRDLQRYLQRALPLHYE